MAMSALAVSTCIFMKPGAVVRLLFIGDFSLVTQPTAGERGMLLLTISVIQREPFLRL